MKNREEFYRSLKAKLKENHSFPILYMFKFIVPSDNDKIARIMGLFGDTADVSMKSSRNGKFTSITAKEVMLSASEVIEKYQQAENVEGLIAL